jgi:hypothetical protein
MTQWPEEFDRTFTNVKRSVEDAIKSDKISGRVKQVRNHFKNSTETVYQSAFAEYGNQRTGGRAGL